MTLLTPELNASLNGLSAAMLVGGYVLIKRGYWRAHAGMMISATAVSSLFLFCYLAYHIQHGEKSTAHSHAPPWLRAIYLLVLLPHLALAVGMLPMIFLTLWRAAHRDWERHQRIAKPTLAIWLYVSITGVIVYLMLYHTSLFS